MPADGDARRSAERERVIALLRQFTTPLLTERHVVTHSVCDGEGRSFGQALADRLQVRFRVATGESLERAGNGLPGTWQPVAPEWRRFLPGAVALTGGSAVRAAASSPARLPAHRTCSGLTQRS
ncbi:hypothetical protein ABZZ20_35345 [Streptomyces sp. NPDC006430]|uniref:hypothetical protein n=1 Tax=Streptomyces sp. NPDC006430 TaxID=3154299 RepID=UPI0033B90683